MVPTSEAGRMLGRRKDEGMGVVIGVGLAVLGYGAWRWRGQAEETARWEGWARADSSLRARVLTHLVYACAKDMAKHLDLHVDDLTLKTTGYEYNESHEEEAE